MGKYEDLINSLFVDGKLHKPHYSALVNSNDRVTGALITALLNHEDPDIRETCAEILNERKTAKAIPSLITALLDEDLNVRQDALWAIENISGYQIGALREWLNITSMDAPKKLHKRVSEWWQLNKKFIERV